MPDWRITQGSTVGALWDQHGEAAFAYLLGNPDCTLADVASGLAVDNDVAKRILDIIESAGGLVRVYDRQGAQRIWATPVMANYVVPNLKFCRSWAKSNDRGTVGQMADSLGLPFAVAYKCAELLQLERDIRLDFLP